MASTVRRRRSESSRATPSCFGAAKRRASAASSRPSFPKTAWRRSRASTSSSATPSKVTAARRRPASSRRKRRFRCARWQLVDPKCERCRRASGRRRPTRARVRVCAPLRRGVAGLGEGTLDDGDRRDCARRYEGEVRTALTEKFGYRNVHAGAEAREGRPQHVGRRRDRELEGARRRRCTSCRRSAARKPVITKAKKSIAAFKLREGMNIGCKVTLRGERMYVFLDKLFNIVLPRIRDFRGLSRKSFDGRGNYNWGCASRSCSRRSTSTRSTRCAAWTS